MCALKVGLVLRCLTIVIVAGAFMGTIASPVEVAFNANEPIFNTQNSNESFSIPSNNVSFTNIPNSNETVKYSLPVEIHNKTVPLNGRGLPCSPTAAQLKELHRGVEDPAVSALLSLSLQLHSSSIHGFGNERLSRLYKQEACHRITRRLDYAMAPIARKSQSCNWNYTCNYEENRYPHYIIQANCINDECVAKRSSNGCISGCDGRFLNTCHPLTVPMTVLRWNCSSTKTEMRNGVLSSVAESIRQERVDVTLGCGIKPRQFTS